MGRRLALVAVATMVAAPCARAAGPSVSLRWIHYRTVHGEIRSAIVELPRWYGPHRHPPIPLVISPHGSGVEPLVNARRWGDLPAVGRFAVVDPEGQGSHLALYSWGSPAQIADLARMPRLVRTALPWLRVDLRRVYAVGGSMGGQESLLLAAEHPRLLAGVVSFDAPANMASRYAVFHRLLKRLATREQDAQSGRLYRDIRRLDPLAPVVEVVGRWHHTAEMHAGGDLPRALR